MRCPYCSEQDSRVVDSRHCEDNDSIRRRRECVRCGRRYTTYETVETLPIIVIKQDGSRESFDRSKVIQSMMRAFGKRKVNIETLEAVAADIEQEIQNSLDREVSTVHIGELVLSRLRPLDEVAYIRFASVYRAFQDVNGFLKEISLLQEK